MSVVYHSWARRSGKTGAAITTALMRKWKYYNCGGEAWSTRIGITHGLNPSMVTHSLRGLRCVVVDNYEVATDEERAIIVCMPHAEVFGTLGPIEGDWRIGNEEQLKRGIQGIKDGIISVPMFMQEHMNAGRI